MQTEQKYINFLKPYVNFGHSVYIFHNVFSLIYHRWRLAMKQYFEVEDKNYKTKSLEGTRDVLVGDFSRKAPFIFKIEKQEFSNFFVKGLRV